MDRQKLSQLKYLKNEIKLLQERVDSIETRTTSDSVKASQTEWPYIEYTAKIEGINTQEYDKKLRRLQREMNRRVGELMDLVEEIEEYIQNIDDSLTRQIISLRYINGLPWEQVAASIGGGNTADSVRMICNRHLDKN